MVNRTNLPSRGTTREVGGMISASRRKNTVRERRMEMDKLTCTIILLQGLIKTSGKDTLCSLELFSIIMIIRGDY